MKLYLSDKYQRVLIRNTSSKNYLSDWEKVKLGVAQGSILGPLLFLVYINDLPGSINNLSNLSKLTLFADDTNIIFTHPNPSEFEDSINKEFEKLNSWFHTNLPSLNLNKTHCMQFVSKSNYAVNMNINYKNNLIKNVCHTNFLGLTLDSTLSWKSHIDQHISKLNSACYVIRSLKSLTPLETLRMFYYASVHSIISYGIISWGNCNYSNTIFKLQKRAIRIIVNAGNR